VASLIQGIFQPNFFLNGLVISDCFLRFLYWFPINKNVCRESTNKHIPDKYQTAI